MKYTSGFSTVPLDLSTRGKIEELLWYFNLRLAVFWIRAMAECVSVHEFGI